MDGTSDYYTIWSYDYTAHSNPYYAQQLRVNTSSSTLILAFNNGSGNVSLEVANSVEFNKWQHIVATFEKASQKLYVNGTLVGSATNDVTITYYAQEVWIGKANFSGGEFAGEMQKVRFFNNVLDATEVKELYSGASVPFKYKFGGEKIIASGDRVPSGSVGNWVFNGTAGGSVAWDGTLSAIKVTSGGSGTARGHLSTTYMTGLKEGQILEFTAEVYIPSTNGSWTGLNMQQADFGGGASTAENTQANVSTKDSWQSIKSTITLGTDVTGKIEVDGDTGSAGQIFYFRNISAKIIGCVAEYDGSGIASDKWLDKSGNDLHGTVTGASVENAPTNDDGLVYEEGTFDVAIASGSGTITVDSSYNLFNYIRIGNLVKINGRCRVSAISSNSGELTITGLPYASSAGSGEDSYWNPITVYLRGASSSVDNGVVGAIGQSSTTIEFFENSTVGTGNDLADHIDTGSFIMIGGTYTI